MPAFQSVARQTTPVTAEPLDTSTNASSILAINGAFAGITLLIVFARVYVRTIMLKTFGVDDYFIVAAMVCGVGVLVCFVGETHHGLGMHIPSMSIPQIQGILKWIFFHSIIVTIGISFVKISLAFFLLRLVTGTWYKRFLYGMVAFLGCFTIACVGTLIFSCIPVEASWNFALKPTAKCYSDKTFTSLGIFNSSVNIATDVLFACLPIPIVWNLNVNLRTRISLIAILSLGFFACTASIIKTVLQAHILFDPDWMRNDSYFIWNNVELHVGIIAACLPSLRPLFAALLEGAKSLKTRATGLGSSTARQHRYYMQEEGSVGGIRMGSLPLGGMDGSKGGKLEASMGGGRYDARVTARSHNGMGIGESEENLKDRESDEVFIMREGKGIMRSVDISVH